MCMCICIRVCGTEMLWVPSSTVAQLGYQCYLARCVYITDCMYICLEKLEVDQPGLLVLYVSVPHCPAKCRCGGYGVVGGRVSG